MSFMKTAIASAILAFILVGAGIILFGFYGADTPQDAIMFSAGAFAIILFTLGAIYIIFHEKAEGLLQHTIIVLAILLLAIGLGLAASNLKDSYNYQTQKTSVRAQLQADIAALESKNAEYTTKKAALEEQLLALQQQNQQTNLALQTYDEKQKNAQAAKNQAAQDQQTIDAMQAQIDQQNAQIQQLLNELAAQQQAQQGQSTTQQSTRERWTDD